MLNQIQEYFRSDKVLYTKHARDEMEADEFGEIREQEICEAVLNGKIIEVYPDDEPYPSCLVYGNTEKARPIHVVCACAEEADLVIIVTAYHPDPDRWTQYERRKK
jgi:hypothetical protein